MRSIASGSDYVHRWHYRRDSLLTKRIVA